MNTDMIESYFRVDSTYTEVRRRIYVHLNAGTGRA